jgi:hypothetical protein
MKTGYIKMNWLIPSLGIALVAVGVIAAATYLDLERQNHSAEVSMARMARLHQDLQLCGVLRTIQAGDVSSAARQLDLLVCNDIVAVNSQLASADPEDCKFIRNAFVRFALIRPRSAALLTDATQELRSDQIEAETILAQAGDGIMPGTGSVAGIR